MYKRPLSGSSSSSLVASFHKDIKRERVAYSPPFERERERGSIALVSSFLPPSLPLPLFYTVSRNHSVASAGSSSPNLVMVREDPLLQPHLAASIFSLDSTFASQVPDVIDKNKERDRSRDMG